MYYKWEMSSYHFCLFALYFLWNEPDADERLRICQLYCSISISMPANDDHSFLSQMLRFAIYITTCNCKESCEDSKYFLWKLYKHCLFFYLQDEARNGINKIERNCYLVYYLWDLQELIQFLQAQYNLGCCRC